MTRTPAQFGLLHRPGPGLAWYCAERFPTLAEAEAAGAAWAVAGELWWGPIDARPGVLGRPMRIIEAPLKPPPAVRERPVDPAGGARVYTVAEME